MCTWDQATPVRARRLRPPRDARRRSPRDHPTGRWTGERCRGPGPSLRLRRLRTPGGAPGAGASPRVGSCRRRAGGPSRRAGRSRRGVSHSCLHVTPLRAGSLCRSWSRPDPGGRTLEEVYRRDRPGQVTGGVTLSALLWWLIPLGATLIALTWATARSRPRRMADTHETVGDLARFRAAMRKPLPADRPTAEQRPVRPSRATRASAPRPGRARRPADRHHPA